MTIDPLVHYASRIRALRRTHAAVSEPALAPAFQELLQTLLQSLPTAPKLTVVPEFAKPDIGRPDIALKRPGQPARAFIELKAPTKPADPARWKDAHDRRQFARFGNLHAWGLSNFEDFRLYALADLVGVATIVPGPALDPKTPDAKAEKLVRAHDPEPFVALLRKLALADVPPSRNASELATNLAHAARLVRETVRERLDDLRATKETTRPLQVVRDEFRNVLYAHPEAGGYRGEFDTLFSAAFAQTLAFGLLLVREATGKEVDADAWRQMPAEHPLMRTALRVLSEEEIVEQVKLGFEILFDTINSFAPAILAGRPGGRDPILYFYEDFLATFDPEARQRYGVYYTPVEVVRYMVGALDRVLREDLGMAGLGDEHVTVLDPATGTGTFLLGVAERVRADAVAAAGEVMAALKLRELAKRLFGFELLIGPYAVAHYRLHHALAEPAMPGSAPPPALPRLGIYLADTLAEPGTSAPMGKLGYTADPIRDERAEADRIKREQRILAIIGNPPYWRFEGVTAREQVGPFLDDLWQDLKKPVRDAGWANQLNTFPEFSIAFWRWAIWKLFEADDAPRKGVIAFITNRTFLAGKPYAGLRKMLRERFDRIEVIDLRGDLRRGARAGVVGDAGVFNIQVGTAITIAVADGSKAEGILADIQYLDSWEQNLFSAKTKLEWLEVGSAVGKPHGAIVVSRTALAPFRPAPFEVQKAIDLQQMFSFKKSGVKTQNDAVLVALSSSNLKINIAPVLADRDNPNYEKDRERAVIYRPLDRRILYNDPRLVKRYGPKLQAVWGSQNRALYAMPFATGEGPAVWCHALLPDYHSFSGRGGYAFPLYDRRPGHDTVNLSPALLDGLALAYTGAVTAEAVFDATLALLSATSYTLRFSEDLEDVFPHVPFPVDRAVFDRAAAIGAHIREIEIFARAPLPAYLPPSLARIETMPSGPLGPVRWEEGALTLCGDGSGRVTGLPEAVWGFAVSGYRVLPRWLAAREGLALDHALAGELRDITGRINELIHRFDEADLVLAEAVQHSLTRDTLGLGLSPSEPDDDQP